jgi:hypothetical protein
MEGGRSDGLPLHDDNQTIVKERIYFDKAESGILHDEITVIDNAFTHPWTITKNYRRAGGARPVWREHVCAEHNQHIKISGDTYFLSADGHLMPTKKDQPPDLKYFKDGEVNRCVRIADGCWRPCAGGDHTPCRNDVLQHAA